MPKLKLTKTNIDRVRKPGTGTVIYVDTETKGFGLRVTASGAASFVVQGMIAGQSKEARITIGTYGAWTVDDARRRAEEYKHQFEDGIDPREMKKQDEAMKVTLRQVADAYFDRPGQPLRDSTKAEMNRHIDKVFAKWADKPIASITIDDCRHNLRVADIVDAKLRAKRPPATPTTTVLHIEPGNVEHPDLRARLGLS